MAKRILLAEDEENLRRLYEEELEEEGYEVFTAGNGKEAIQEFERRKPDLIVLDIIMPLMDGIEALRRIREKDKKVPVVLHTSHPEYHLDPRSKAADEFILKSGDLRNLKETIHRLLN
jgi:two-component system response regulator (stage 0 sporulation protein F)